MAGFFGENMRKSEGWYLQTIFLKFINVLVKTFGVNGTARLGRIVLLFTWLVIIGFVQFKLFSSLSEVMKT